MPIRSYKDLDVYQRSYANGIKLIRDLLPTLPKEEKFDLVDQLRRSGKAIPRLIAEGYGKKNQKRGFHKYIDDAIAENNETVVGLHQICDLYSQYVNINLVKELIDSYEIIGKQLFRLQQAWKNLNPTSYI